MKKLFILALAAMVICKPYMIAAMVFTADSLC